MYVLTAASQAVVSAAAHAVASSAGASPRSGLPRTQIDTVSAVQLTSDEELTGMNDRSVAQEVSLQSVVVEITALALIASAGVRAFDATHGLA